MARNNRRIGGYPAHWTDQMCDTRDAIKDFEKSLAKLSEVVGEEVACDLHSSELRRLIQKMKNLPKGMHTSLNSTEVYDTEEYD